MQRLTLLFIHRLVLRVRRERALSVNPISFPIPFHSENRTLTIISSFFATLIPFLFVTCKYFNPLSTSCCTTKFAFMRNLAPSLIVKGFDFSASTEPGAARSMVISGRPWTSRASDLMTQRRLSLGSTWMAGDEEMPSEAFQRLRDSSFWSGSVDVRRIFK